MADDTNPNIHPMDFHSCDTPRGMLYYNMDDLTSFQQTKLNDLKMKTIREDEQYLAGHPEIRACVALITRYVLQKCPRNNLHDVIAQFFARSKVDIEEEIKDYIKERGDHHYEGDSAVGLYAKSASQDSTTFDDMSTLTYEQDKISDSLQNIAVNLNDIEAPPSGTVISSISEITDPGMYHGSELDKIKKIIHTHLVEDIIVSDMLSKIPYHEEDEDGLDLMDDFTHIPVSAKVSFSPHVRTFAKPTQKSSDQLEKLVKESVDKIIDTEVKLVENTNSSHSTKSALKSNSKTNKLVSDDATDKKIDDIAEEMDGG